MQDPANLPVSAAGYPWKADGDFTTVIYVKNETDRPQKYTMHLLYEGGQYSMGVSEIRPNETVAVDFRKLRDSQTPDGMGRLIPLGANKGQIAWSVKGIEDKVLSSRSEQISLSTGVASTYACYNCCPNSTYDSFINPQANQIAFEAYTFFIANQTESSCNNVIYGPYQAESVSWSSNNVNVATVDGGEIFGAGVGEADISATFTSVLWFNFGEGHCQPWYDEITRSEPVEVVPSVSKIQYKVNGVWSDIPSGGLGPICNGASVTFRAVPTSGTFPSGKPTWGGDASGTGVENAVTFSTAGSRTVSATSGNTISATINVGAANGSINITWGTPAVTTLTTTGDAEAFTRPFVPEYTACADPGANLWKMRAKKVDGGTDFTIRTGGYRNPISSPPISQTEAVAANTAMNEYYTMGRRSWHTPSASEAHENHHNSEWTCTGNHFWGPTETAIETLTASYTMYSSETAAITQMKTMAGGANEKMTAFLAAANTYYGTLSDAFGSRPYAAGQAVLNGRITIIVALANTNSWTGVPDVAATPSAANPCYQTFQAYP